MSEYFLQACKWYVLALCAVVGTSAFIISDDTGSIKPVMIGVLSYGVIYIMSIFWTEFRGKVLLFSFLTFLGISIASPYIPTALYILFGYTTTAFNEYALWAAAMGVIGIPIMTIVFRKYGD